MVALLAFIVVICLVAIWEFIWSKPELEANQDNMDGIEWHRK